MSPEELTTWLSCITKEQIGWTYNFFDFQITWCIIWKKILNAYGRHTMRKP